MRRFCFVPFVILLIAEAAAQNFPIQLNPSDNTIIRQWLDDQPLANDSVSWVLARNTLISRLHDEGFLLASVDSWFFQNDTLFANITPGQKFHWARLQFRGREYLPPHWVEQLDVSGEVIHYNAWRQNILSVLKTAQAEGYLFANYRLNILSLQNDSLSAEVVFEPGLQILLDTIDIEGNAKLSKEYLEKSLGLKQGQPITPADIEYLQQQLNNLRFVQQVSPPVLILLQEKATLRLYLNNRQASSFDVLAGLQPATSDPSNITITGYVDLDLVNQLARGERIYLHLEKLRPRSQEVRMAASYPYFLDLPFGLEGDFKLTKNDTLFSDIFWKGGIVMPLGRNQFVRAGLSQQATNLISINRNEIIATKRLPPYVDLRINGLQLGLIRSRLDFDLNPRRGYSLSLDGNISQKKIRISSLIGDLNNIDPTFDYATLYDTLSEASTRIAIEAAVQYFIPWGTRSAIRLAVDGGLMESGNRIFINEMYRLGGYSRLRGFDEESIFAQYYSIFSAEYRLIIGEGSYIALFSDYAWIKNEDVATPIEDRPYGFGIGLTLETKAGIFGMRAAVGSQFGNAIDFNNARIHFGYVNRF